MKELINWSALSRYITGKTRQNLVYPNKVSKMYWGQIDNLIYNDLPKWWEKFKSDHD